VRSLLVAHWAVVPHVISPVGVGAVSSPAVEAQPQVGVDVDVLTQTLLVIPFDFLSPKTVSVGTGEGELVTFCAFVKILLRRAVHHAVRAQQLVLVMFPLVVLEVLPVELLRPTRLACEGGPRNKWRWCGYGWWG